MEEVDRENYTIINNFDEKIYKNIIDDINLFDKYFDKETFPEYLYPYCIDNRPDKFDVWYDKKTFPKKYYIDLVKYCRINFDIWFDEKNNSDECYLYFAKYYLNKFDIWFDKKTYPNKLYDFIGIFCPDKFDIWFDKEKIPRQILHCYTLFSRYHIIKVNKSFRQYNICSFNIWFDDDNNNLNNSYEREVRKCCYDSVIKLIKNLDSNNLKDKKDQVLKYYSEIIKMEENKGDLYI